jgi:hydroxymethylglutaryl-CoA lyase
MTAAPADVTVIEVGPRDGLQNEPARLTTSDKIAFVDRLSAAGLPIIEIGAFVHPTWVPTMSDTGAVAAGIQRRPGTNYLALVPNETGAERAIAARLNGISLVVAASETFSQRNTNASIATSLERARAAARRATNWGLDVRAYLSTAFGCPFEGDIPVSRVVELASALRDLGASQIAVSDTIGIAHPGDVRRRLDALLATLPVAAIALHFHDTWGMAAANVLAAREYGIRAFDASAGGLGGCPYAPGATGNLATEDLLYLLHGTGVRTGVDLDQVFLASTSIEPAVGHELPSRYVRARRARERQAAAPPAHG